MEKETTFWPSSGSSLVRVNSPDREEPAFPSCFSPRSESSDDSVVPERLEQHRVLDIAEHPADVVGVCGAGEVRVQSLSLLPLVVVDGLLLVQLADVVLGVLWVSFLPCQTGEKEMMLTTKRQR